MSKTNKTNNPDKDNKGMTKKEFDKKVKESNSALEKETSARKKNSAVTAQFPRGVKAKNDKPVTIWAVFDKENPDEPITFTATPDEAIVALDQYLYLKNYKHFRLWCPLHNLPIDHGNSWREYSKTMPDLDNASDKYVIAKMDYDPRVIAMVLRVFNNCTPLGCPFDTEEELGAYSEYLSNKSELVAKGEETYTPIEEALDLLFDDLDAINSPNVEDADTTPSPGGYDA